MNNLYESKNYDLTFRGILSNNIFKMYTNNDIINISSEISFDINADYASSINYFAASILGGISHNIVSQSKQHNIDIEELEGKIHLNLKNLTRNTFLQVLVKGGLPLRQDQVKRHLLEKNVFWSAILKTHN